MVDPNEELSKKIDKLEKEVEDLKKRLEDNTKADRERDERHHQEIKTIQEKNHKENMTWSKTGAILTPLAVAIIPFVVKFFERNKTITPQTIQPIKKDADDISEKMDRILKAIERKDGDN